MTKIKNPAVIICTFLWIGFVCAISFMEAWLKFRAPGITLALGLGIGRIVFGALNKVEWVFAIVLLVHFFISKAQQESNMRNIAYLVVLLILVAQTVWLLPALDVRAQMHIDNLPIPPSNIHFWFVGAEVIKVISLFVFGISLFNSFSKWQEKPF